MSATHTTPAPAPAPTVGREAGSNRRSALRWIAGGTTVAAAVCSAAIALWPASEADQARADGKAFGEAVGSLYSADTQADVDAALSDMQTAVDDTRSHAGDAVADQAADQGDALERAADGFVGVHTSDDAFSVDLYQAELNDAVDDLAGQADDFRTQGPEVRQAFWEGVDEGLPQT
jgi:hypothetical protein